MIVFLSFEWILFDICSFETSFDISFLNCWCDDFEIPKGVQMPWEATGNWARLLVLLVDLLLGCRGHLLLGTS